MNNKKQSNTRRLKIAVYCNQTRRPLQFPFVIWFQDDRMKNFVLKTDDHEMYTEIEVPNHLEEMIVGNRAYNTRKVKLNRDFSAIRVFLDKNPRNTMEDIREMVHGQSTARPDHAIGASAQAKKVSA